MTPKSLDFHWFLSHRRDSIEHMFDNESGAIPSYLEDIPPGPELGGLLALVDVEELSGHERILVLRAEQRMESYYQARKYRTMASVVDTMEDPEPEWAEAGAAAEIQAALRLTRNASEQELSFALCLQRRLPQVWEALARGLIDVRRAKCLWHRTVHLSAAAARSVVDRVIEAAPGLTTGQLNARIDRLCVEADPTDAEQRYRHAVSRRRLAGERTDDGTANLLGLDLPPHLVSTTTRHINRLASDLKTAGDPRTMDQLRADVFLDLLSGKSGRVKAVVDIQVDLDTLAGLSEHPGELNGFGPVIADIARQVAAEQEDAEWRFSLTDPETGRVLANGTTRRRPTASQRRAVEARDRHCIFPGCRMPAIDCDLDHEMRWADGGATCVDKLVAACRRHHVIRHRFGWVHRPHGTDDHLWISPLGHRYTTSGQPP
jgi:Domain of unknown function (DUF222)